MIKGTRILHGPSRYLTSCVCML